MDFIKKTWENQAKEFGESHAASWKDIYAMQLEIDTIGQFIKKDDHVLDVGCANGYSSFPHLSKQPTKIIGVDFAEQMVHHAREAKSKNFPDAPIQFEVADVRKLPFESNSFDVVYTTRVLINLPNWEEQQVGILECLRVAKPGAVVILSEAFWEPLVKLNSLRTIAGLPSLVEHDFNRYLKKSKLTDFIRDRKLSFETIAFSSIYYLGSRFVRELTEGLPDSSNYQNEINSIFFELEKKYKNSNDFGIQQAFVIRK